MSLASAWSSTRHVPSRHPPENTQNCWLGLGIRGGLVPLVSALAKNMTSGLRLQIMASGELLAESDLCSLTRWSDGEQKDWD
jgi:hypothetical protein